MNIEEQLDETSSNPAGLIDDTRTTSIDPDNVGDVLGTLRLGAETRNARTNERFLDSNPGNGNDRLLANDFAESVKELYHILPFGGIAVVVRAVLINDGGQSIAPINP